jgi:hypothetical protein
MLTQAQIESHAAALLQGWVHGKLEFVQRQLSISIDGGERTQTLRLSFRLATLLVPIPANWPEWDLLRFTEYFLKDQIMALLLANHLTFCLPLSPKRGLDLDIEGD